jgi:hypothetical protein
MPPVPKRSRDSAYTVPTFRASTSSISRRNSALPWTLARGTVQRNQYHS